MGAREHKILILFIGSLIVNNFFFHAWNERFKSRSDFCFADHAFESTAEVNKITFFSRLDNRI